MIIVVIECIDVNRGIDHRLPINTYLHINKDKSENGVGRGEGGVIEITYHI